MACARIVRETGPSSAELEAIENQPDPLEKYQQDVAQARVHGPAVGSGRAAPAQGKQATRPRERPGKGEAPAAPKPSWMRDARPDAATQSHGATRNASVAQRTTEPLAPANTHASAHPAHPRPERHSIQAPHDGRALAAVRAAMAERPRTAMAPHRRASAASDGEAGPSSASTSRSNTTRDPERVSASTGLTSFAHTPADDKRASGHAAPAGPGFPPRNSSRDARARQLLAQEIARRERVRDIYAGAAAAESPATTYATAPTSAATAPPASGGPRPLQRHASQASVRDDPPHRPKTRAGSFRDNLVGGLRDYIQPRPSVDRHGSSRSRSRARDAPAVDAPSRPGSRATVDPHRRPGSSGSHDSRTSGAGGGRSRSWLRGAASGLRRKGSWSSFRSHRRGGGGEESGDEGERGRKTERGPDLNRSLPPLPGLETYREKKAKTHIAQLLAYAGPEPASDATAPAPYEFAAVAPPPPADPHPAADIDPPTTSLPRIPFADSEAAWAAARPSGREQRKIEARLSKQGFTGAEYERRREEEIRRAVRAKMLQGAGRLAGSPHRRVASDGRSLPPATTTTTTTTTDGADLGPWGAEARPSDPVEQERWRKERRNRERRADQERRGVREAAPARGAERGREVREARWKGGEAERADAPPAVVARAPPDEQQRKKTLRNRLSRLWGGSAEAGRVVVAN